MRSRTVQCLSPAGLHRMAYTEWGDAANPRVLVCVHGLTRCGRDFDFLAEALTDIADEAVRKLCAVNPDDKNEIIRQQAIVEVCQSLPLMLQATILRTGEKDGGVTA